MAAVTPAVDIARAIQVVKGSEPVLVAREVERVLEALKAGGFDGIEEFAGDDFEVGQVAMAAATPSMFSKRAIVVRDVARFGSGDWQPLIDWAVEPGDSRVVLVWERGSAARMPTIPKALTAALDAHGQVHLTDAPSGRDRAEWIRNTVANWAVKLERDAIATLVDALGDEPAGIVEAQTAIEGAFPAGSRLSAADIQPYVLLGGGVPPWDLTDAIDSGDRQRAVAVARRMMGAGGRHPLQVMASLTSHVMGLAALAGAACRDDREAAALMGLKGSTFPAKKARATVGRLGQQRVARAVELVATADVETRGATGVDSALVVEILVARLAGLAGRGRAGGGSR